MRRQWEKKNNEIHNLVIDWSKKMQYNQLTALNLRPFLYIYIYIYISGAEMGLVLLMPGTTNNSVNVIQNGLKIIH